MPTTEQLLDEGLAHHQAGRFAEAVRLYEEVLRLDPRHADALHLLGLVYHQRGQHDSAVAYIRWAIDAKPGAEVFWENLGAVYQALGRYPDAVDAARQVLRLNPGSGKAHFNLGCALKALGDLDGAAASFLKSTQCADLLRKEGIALRKQGKLEEAIRSHQKALAINPDYAEAHSNLGVVLREQGKMDEAILSHQRALEINPQFAAAYNNLGNALSEQGKFDEAIVALQKALEINPNYAEAHGNLGAAFHDQGKLDEAIRSLQRALAISPNYAEVHMNLGFCFLKQGQYETGWDHYEWRWRTGGKEFRPRGFTQPQWDGGLLEGKTLLVHAEQGLGDTIQFVRYAPLLRQRGCCVILECQKPLRALLSGFPGIDQLVARGEKLPFDYHIPLLSLPHLLGTRADSIPADVPYLFAPDDLVRKWGDRLGNDAGFKVGICWQGNPTFKGDRTRSIGLAEFARLGDVPGVRLFSLQHGPGREQLSNNGFPITDLDPLRDPDPERAWLDTAAALKCLNLFVCSDSAVAHLAGALGVPTWLALAKVSDWRWLLDREDSPWYPTMRLFRQETAGDWAGVFRRIAQALRERVPSPVAQG